MLLFLVVLPAYFLPVLAYFLFMVDYLSLGESAVGLATGSKVSRTQEIELAGEWSRATGGLMPLVRDRQRDRDDDTRVQKALTSTFAAGTGIRNEDADMLKYIDEQMAAKRNEKKEETRQKSEFERMQEDLYIIPEELARLKAQPVDERAVPKGGMLSSAVLSGIPEFDLGLDTKIANIEQTEEARQMLASGHLRPTSRVASIVPKALLSTRNEYAGERCK